MEEFQDIPFILQVYSAFFHHFLPKYIFSEFFQSKKKKEEYMIVYRTIWKYHPLAVCLAE